MWLTDQIWEFFKVVKQAFSSKELHNTLYTIPLYSNSVADGEEYSGQMIMNLERARIRASHNSTSSSKLLGVVGIDFPIFGDFGK